MRLSLPLVFAAILTLAATEQVFADEPIAAPVDARVAARHALECAKLEMRLYMDVEYPREVRHLESAIKFTKAEVDVLERRVREYDRFGRFQRNPLQFSLENSRLALLDAELRLKDLQAELFALRRYHSDRCRMLELRVYQARIVVVNLEGGPEYIEPAVVEEPLDSV